MEYSRLQALRKTLDISLAESSEYLGLGKKTLLNIEDGLISPSSLDKGLIKKLDKYILELERRAREENLIPAEQT